MPFQLSMISPRNFGLAPGMKPVREIRPRKRRHTIPGWFSTDKAVSGKRIRTETLLELDGLAIYETDPRYTLMAGQPHRLVFFERMSDGTHVKRTYTPDLAVLARDGRIAVVDFKHTYFRSSLRWQHYEPLIRQAYEEDHGVSYTLVDEKDVYLEPRQTNFCTMLHHRTPVEDTEALLAARSAIARLGLPTSIGAVRLSSNLGCSQAEDRAFSVLIRMALAGEICLDMTETFDDRTTITVGPL